MFSLQDMKKKIAAEDLNKIVIDPSLTVAKAIPCDVEGALGSLVIMVMIDNRYRRHLFVWFHKMKWYEIQNKTSQILRDFQKDKEY